MKYGRVILKILCVACTLQVLLTIYLILKIYISSVIRPDQIIEADYDPNIDNSYNLKLEIIGENEAKENFEDIVGSHRIILSKSSKKFEIEIWAKAAIASYLWEHILGGAKSISEYDPSIYTGQLLTTHCNFNYKEGPGLQPGSSNHTIDKLIFVSNGRTSEKVDDTRKWLDYLNRISDPPKVLLMLLGNEKCDNQWIQKYVYPNGPVRGVFLTYDDSAVDSETFFQWPLGVATYRKFPNLNEEQVALSNQRKFICNLMATNHINSSRNELFQNAYFNKYCHISERKTWEPTESVESMNKYVDILIQSDLTLCPSGFNTETYRVYEALAAGSVPVIEDNPSSGFCDRQSGWRLLKQFNAPVIWIKSWNELTPILQKEKSLHLGQKIERRKRLFSWYEWFKFRNKDRFLAVVENKLLKPD